MEKATFDPGLTQQFSAPLRRIINKDGSFNVDRHGVTWRDVHPYLHLINMSWGGFLSAVFSAYLGVNTLFAPAYFFLGSVRGSEAATSFERFTNDFFFSAQTWTIVHPIDSESPFFGKTAEELERVQAEVLILIKGWDDTFSQTVHSRHSYRYDEITWRARFQPAFHVDGEGDLVVEVDRVGDLTAV